MARDRPQVQIPRIPVDELLDDEASPAREVGSAPGSSNQMSGDTIVALPGIQHLETFDQAVLHWARKNPSGRSFTWVNKNGQFERSLTFQNFDGQVTAVAAAMKHRVPQLQFQSRVILCFTYDDGIDFILCFFAAMRIGVIPVPVSPVLPDKFDISIGRLDHIIRDCTPECVLTSTAHHAFIAIQRLAYTFAADTAGGNWRTIRWVVLPMGMASVPAQEPRPAEPVVPSTVAFLQYTSGSTGDGKGVVITHKCAIAQARLISGNFDYRLDGFENTVSWLPLFHDMGLVGVVMTSALVGSAAHLMSPLTFLQRPDVYVRALANCQGTHSAVPNFALHLLATRVDIPALQRKLRGDDLSALRALVCGAEPIQPETVRRFCEAYAPLGFQPGMLYASFGLAEHVLCATTRVHARWAPVKPSPPLVLRAAEVDLHHKLRYREAAPLETAVLLSECGTAPAGVTVRIVDPMSFEELEERHIGEVWLRSQCVAGSYFGQPQASRETFGARIRGEPAEAGPYLRTGDLGFVLDGVLFITGRIKDLIIVAGANYFPQDIEILVEVVPGVRLGCVAACATRPAGAVTDALLIVAEVKGTKGRRGVRKEGLAACADAIANLVTQKAGLAVFVVALIPEHALVKTGSGRVTCR